MKYKTIKLLGNNSQELNTELAFEIAVAKADGEELIKFDVQDSDDAAYTATKKLSTIKKLLRTMKDGRKIQFYASADSFEKSSTEAVFLINKYPDIIENIPSDQGEYIFVKL